MKICLVSDQYTSRGSGIGLHTNNMVEGLLERNHEVILICSDKEKKKIKDFVYIPVLTKRFDPSPNRWFSLAWQVNKMMPDLYARYKFDIFHSLDARQGSLAARGLAIPTIGSVNDYYYAIATLNFFDFINDYKGEWLFRYIYYNLLKKFEKKTYHNFDLLIANSRVTREEIVKNYHLPLDKVRTASKAIRDFPSERNQILEKQEGDYNILMVGFGLARKGFHYLIEAAQPIIDQFPNVRFWIAGNANKAILKRVRAAKVQNSFTFFGPLPPEKLSGLFRKADIFIMPSLIEGFGVAVVEAMSYGLPVIGTDVGGLKDIIKDRENGLLISPRSSQSISRAVSELLKDISLRERLSKRGFNSARFFNSKMQLEETIKVYDELREKKENRDRDK